MPTRLYINLCQTYIPMYLHVSLNMPAASLAYIPLTMYLSSFLISLIIERLNTKLGRRVAYSIGALLAICASVWIQFGNDVMYVKYEIYAVAVMLGKPNVFIVGKFQFILSQKYDRVSNTRYFISTRKIANSNLSR